MSNQALSDTTNASLWGFLMEASKDWNWGKLPQTDREDMQHDILIAAFNRLAKAGPAFYNAKGAKSCLIFAWMDAGRCRKARIDTMSLASELLAAVMSDDGATDWTETDVPSNMAQWRPIAQDSAYETRETIARVWAKASAPEREILVSLYETGFASPGGDGAARVRANRAMKGIRALAASVRA